VLKEPDPGQFGSIVTFQNKTGVCFELFLSLVSMCRAVGVKVRLVSGLGRSGSEWGEHVWNQIYDPAEEKWVMWIRHNGSADTIYFGNSDFSSSPQI